jgi:hypothetical protein
MYLLFSPETPRICCLATQTPLSQARVHLAAISSWLRPSVCLPSLQEAKGASSL